MPGVIYTTPGPVLELRLYLSSSIDLAMVVLDKCRKEYDNRAREYNYEFLEDFSDLYMEDKCPRFNDGNFYAHCTYTDYGYYTRYCMY